MVAVISIVLAVYEALALATGRPTITRISHTRVGVLVWLWLVSLTIHLIRGDEAPPLWTTPRLALRPALPVAALWRRRRRAS